MPRRRDIPADTVFCIIYCPSSRPSRGRRPSPEPSSESSSEARPAVRLEPKQPAQARNQPSHRPKPDLLFCSRPASAGVRAARTQRLPTPNVTAPASIARRLPSSTRPDYMSAAETATSPARLRQSDRMCLESNSDA
ncbi:hypothetical protein CDD83_39 [Cordyceps sp. RAO-2017]|nr:hypothetical protein CDD83_39 [Cordyceps sp. RAO-2017]